MVSDRAAFPRLLHQGIFTTTLFLGSFGILNYLCFGDSVEQIATATLPEGAPVVVAVKYTLVVAILCTYPLQLFPVIQVAERYVFGIEATVGGGEADASINAGAGAGAVAVADAGAGVGVGGSKQGRSSSARDSSGVPLLAAGDEEGREIAESKQVYARRSKRLPPRVRGARLRAGVRRAG